MQRPRLSWSLVHAQRASHTMFSHWPATLRQKLKESLSPVAQSLVMAAQRTFWDKATAAHVHCLRGRLRGERYSRHWYELAVVAKTPHFSAACADHVLARAFAEHKSVFFIEKDATGKKIDYFAAQNFVCPCAKSTVAVESLALRLSVLHLLENSGQMDECFKLGHPPPLLLDFPCFLVRKYSHGQRCFTSSHQPAAPSAKPSDLKT
jgi:Nucleotidyl transferase AbiEii toxin, Type IV TA system